jgi:YVTN family beta-propeller protein
VGSISARWWCRVTYALGIDIGTTYSAAAVWRDGRAETVPFGDRANVVPSVVLLREDGTLVVGDAAVRRAVSESRRVAREFKRRIGDRVPVMLGDQRFEAQQLLAAMVRWIAERVREREGAAPDHVTLTCPANWGEYRRGLLEEAARDAGLANAELVVEPVAAAIHYASQERIEAGAYIGVYDLGGGTFDATVLRKTDGGFEVYGTPMGDDRLGGIDFDQAVLSRVAAVLGDRWAQLDLTDRDTLRAVAQVRDSAVEAKEALSTDVEAVIPVILPGITEEVRLTRAEFEAAIRLPLQRTVDVFRQTVMASGLELSQLHRVLLIGGSSRIPLVSDLLTQQLDVPVAVDAHPKYAVCLGAAVAAGARLSGAALPGDAPTSPDATPEHSADQADTDEVARDVVAEPDAAGDRSVLEALVARPREEVGAARAETPEPAATTDDTPQSDDTAEVGVDDAATVQADAGGRGTATPRDPALDDTQPRRPAQPGPGRRRVPSSYLIVALIVVVAGGAVWLLVTLRGRNVSGGDPLPAATPSAAEATSAASETPAAPSEARSAAPVINAGGSPTELAVRDDAVWVTNNDDGTVTRIDPTIDRVVATIEVGSNPSDIIARPDAVWVVNEGNGTVSRIDPATGQIVATIDVGQGISGVSGNRDAIWITNKDAGTVTRVDPVTNAVVATIDVGPSPHDVRLSGGMVWVFRPDDSSIARIDPDINAVVDTIDLGRNPTDIGFEGDDVWVLDSSDNTVTRIDLATIAEIATVDVGAAPSDIAFGADAAWVTNGGDDTVTRIALATNEVTATINVGAGPADVGFGADALWVVNTDDATVSRIDPADTP